MIELNILNQENDFKWEQCSCVTCVCKPIPAFRPGGIAWPSCPSPWKRQFHIHKQCHAAAQSVFPQTQILTSPGMRRGWQTTPYTSHNLRMDLKETIRCLQRCLSLSVSVSCSYIVTLIWSWDRETTPTAVGWEHNTMTVSQTNHSSSVVSVLCVDVRTVECEQQLTAVLFRECVSVCESPVFVSGKGTEGTGVQ